MIKVIAAAFGVSPVWLYLATGLAASIGIGTAVWWIYDSGYDAGAAAVRVEWQAAREAEAQRQADANREAKQHQARLVQGQRDMEQSLQATKQEIDNAPPTDSDALPGLGADDMRNLNRLRRSAAP